eukprot:CAMPEP_0114341088 /NCGR_PEP_ID=MMETSP0101-20121206/8812_1 /TAXON_ID=38822 ORGANISM="Pteridomonas danica, Strain PT" /NCGR_SAMPLE_ID=MMETSP0101 /ASSEMBLY_ACC=CAM_ASM_000211 /LENGTH=642 /DNA_ID=CAMNT_0001474571 /DNA_START=107 /DNA_END=2035 /DNA_ORIENTATION=-
MPIRKGKWSQEEEDYVLALINHFEKGLLSVPEGTTLRMYLAQKINCDPMRITKKFAGQNCLGKKAFIPRLREPFTQSEIEQFEEKLSRAENRFNKRLARLNSSDGCMLDFDARQDAYVISSPAIDALVSQTGKGKWGLLGEADLAVAESPLPQLLMASGHHQASFNPHNYLQLQQHNNMNLNPMLPPAVKSRQIETPSNNDSNLTSNSQTTETPQLPNNNSLSKTDTGLKFSESPLTSSPLSSGRRRALSEEHHALLTEDVLKSNTFKEGKKSGSYASFQQYNQENLDVLVPTEEAAEEGADLLLGFFMSSSRHSFSNLSDQGDNQQVSENNQQGGADRVGGQGELASEKDVKNTKTVSNKAHNDDEVCVDMNNENCVDVDDDDIDDDIVSQKLPIKELASTIVNLKKKISVDEEEDKDVDKEEKEEKEEKENYSECKEQDTVIMKTTTTIAKATKKKKKKVFRLSNSKGSPTDEKDEDDTINSSASLEKDEDHSPSPPPPPTNDDIEDDKHLFIEDEDDDDDVQNPLEGGSTLASTLSYQNLTKRNLSQFAKKTNLTLSSSSSSSSSLPSSSSFPFNAISYVKDTMMKRNYENTINGVNVNGVDNVTDTLDTSYSTIDCESDSEEPEMKRMNLVMRRSEEV